MAKVWKCLCQSSRHGKADSSTLIIRLASLNYFRGVKSFESHTKSDLRPHLSLPDFNNTSLGYTEGKPCFPCGGASQ